MTSIFVELITFMIFKLTWALIDIPVHVFGVQVGILSLDKKGRSGGVSLGLRTEKLIFSRYLV